MRLLGIDYGTTRLGLAISQGFIAEPLCIINNDDQLFAQLAAIIATKKPDKIIIGISENTMARRTRQFANQLAQITTLPLELVDETLSSYQVHEYLRQAPRRKKQGLIDHFAAAVILQRYLDEQES